VAIVTTDVSQKLIAYIIRVRRIDELSVVTANVPRSPILSILIMKAVSSSETSVLIKAIRHHMPEDCFLHSHRRDNLKY
jgi:hypothetical protein